MIFYKTLKWKYPDLPYPTRQKLDGAVIENFIEILRYVIKFFLNDREQSQPLLSNDE